MKVTFINKKEGKKVTVKFNEANSLKRLISIANYELYRQNFFNELDLEKVVPVIDDDKVSWGDVIRIAEKKLNKMKYDDDDDYKKDDKKDKKDKKEKKNKKDKKKKKDKYKKTYFNPVVEDNDDEVDEFMNIGAGSWRKYIN